MYPILLPAFPVTHLLWILRPLGSSLWLQGSLTGPQAAGSLVHEYSSHLKHSLRQMHVGTHPQTTLLQPRLRDAPTVGLGVLGLLLRSPHQPSLLGRVGDFRPGTQNRWAQSSAECISHPISMLVYRLSFSNESAGIQGMQCFQL